MTLSRRYDPKDHDFMLFNKWKRGLDDYEISHDFMRQGLNFPLVVVQQARQRLKLKPNKRPEYQNGGEDDVPPPKERPNPLALAKVWLDVRLVEKGGSYFLDGVPTNLVRIMQAFNELRVQAGVEQVLDNPLWGV